MQGSRWPKEALDRHSTDKKLVALLLHSQRGSGIALRQAGGWESYFRTAKGALMDLPISWNHSTTNPTPCMPHMLSRLAGVMSYLAAPTDAQV